ncbi:HIT family protein [Trujillonella endophytica]|uniref:Diadenosine tetraphosphate (Ap4A) hydrolase n=1 Tax=Trujillonella endophytica TaxID=673521 RepID=A0A1H8TZ14_9ACTN|nr:HIT domain-containing protein [Trujillella endophytica]SEO96095.1 Diadenosine tetraphosphate (Ap4A) hydrolase [Trujillella endophytica]
MTAPDDGAPLAMPGDGDPGRSPGEAFEHLWTPYRMAYIRGVGRATGAHDCPFCLIPQQDDEEGLVVARGRTVFAVLNLYPYNAGHLMVVPYRHVPDYTDLTADEVAEMGSFTQTAMRVVRSVSGAHGFNIGMNQGSVAGAGIADHLHQHAVPRWGGDTNFMPVIGLTRVLPQVLRETRALLAANWPAGDAGED